MFSGGCAGRLLVGLRRTGKIFKMFVMLLMLRALPFAPRGGRFTMRGVEIRLASAFGMDSDGRDQLLQVQ